MDPSARVTNNFMPTPGFTKENGEDKKPENRKENYIPNSEDPEKLAQTPITSRTIGLNEEGNQPDTFYPISHYGAEAIIEALSQCFRSDARKRKQMSDMVKKAVSEETLSMEALVDLVSALRGESFKPLNQKLLMENIMKMHQGLLEQPSTSSEESAGTDSIETGIKTLEQIGACPPPTGYKKDILDLKNWVSKLKDLDPQCPDYEELLNQVNEKIKQLVDLNRNIELNIGYYKNIVKEVDDIITSARGSVCFDKLTKTLSSAGQDIAVPISELNKEFSLNSWITNNLTKFSRNARESMEQSGFTVPEIKIANQKDPLNQDKSRPALLLSFTKGVESKYLYYYFSGRSGDGTPTKLSEENTENDHLFDMGAITERDLVNQDNEGRCRFSTGTAICEEDFSRSILTIQLYDQNNERIKSVSTKKGEIDIYKFYKGAENLNTCREYWQTYLAKMAREALGIKISFSSCGFGSTRSAHPVSQSARPESFDIGKSDSNDSEHLTYYVRYQNNKDQK